MVDAFTSTSALSNIVQPAIDQYIRAELRHTPMLRSVADTRPIQVDRPGSSVALYIHGDLAAATTPLSETVDPDAVALPNPTSVTLTPYEYGNVTISTVKTNATAFADVDPYQRDAVAWNMRDTLDALVREIVSGGTNVAYGGTRTSTNTVTAADTLKAVDVRKAVTKLRGNAAPGKRGDLYWCGIHPDVSADLRSESGAGSWQDLHKYAAPGEFWPGEIGVFEGAFFVESARMKKANDGATSATVYRTIFAGREALAEGVVIEPEVRIGVVPDKLNRFFPLGWYGFLGWTRFREKCLYRVETGSAFAS
jgi:N4-gp56 family major capsid protein